MITRFDTSSTMLRALAFFLHGRGFPALGFETRLSPLAGAANLVPPRLARLAYGRFGQLSAVPPRRLEAFRAADAARDFVVEYPCRRYPAVFVGSANGALVHLAAALGAPWLPQTFLLPVRRRADPDDPRAAAAWTRGPAEAVLRRNPELVLHAAHDPSNDRLMLPFMAYFRLKLTRLPEPYVRFVEDVLEPGGALVIVDCRLRWPTTAIGDRHVFQFGEPGGAKQEEYFSGGPRVEEFLRREGAEARRWDPPPPDGLRPDAEWGYEEALDGDLAALAERRGYRLLRLGFEQPEDASPFVADLHRDWYGGQADRLLAESYMLLEPWWALRTRSVPYWLVFPGEPSAARLERYLDEVEPYDEIYATLFSNGIEWIGQAPPARWRALLDRARRRGAYVGVDEETYPYDFAASVRYHTELGETIPARHELPEPLALEEVERFLDGSAGRYGVTLDELVPARRAGSGRT